MTFTRTAFLLLLVLWYSAMSKKIALADQIVQRQILQTLPVCSGTVCAVTTSSMSSTLPTSTFGFSSASSPISTQLPNPSPSSTMPAFPTASSTSFPTSAASYDPYALTTTFIQPPSCTTGGLTVVENLGTDIYNNLIYSQPGLDLDLDYTRCLPPQFYNSVLSWTASVTSGPFTALICPYKWGNYQVNSTYVICCPPHYGLLAPNYNDTVRPGAGAICTSWVAGLYDYTYYDSTGGQTIVGANIGNNVTIAIADAFDGITAGNMSAAGTPTSVSASSTTPSIAISTNPTSSASITTSMTEPEAISSPTSKSSAASRSIPTPFKLFVHLLSRWNALLLPGQPSF